MLSKNKGHDNSVKEELDSTTLPAKSGSLIGSGNYFVVVGIGSPKRDLSLIFDTGSDLTWTQCEPCARSCYKQQDPIFDPSKSTSYSNITCTSSVCTQLTSATGNQPGCASSSNACIYGIQYGDSSFSVGYFSRERLTVTATEVVDNFLFGCGQNNQGLFGGSAGLLGLGRNPISFVEQTATKYKKLFAYCLPSTASNVGYLTFGRVADNYIKYTPLSTNSGVSSFYALDLLGIYVGGAKLSISSSTFSTGGTIIDSGTVITRLPPTAYSALRTEFQKGMSRYPKASALSILDTCYDLSGYKVFAIPKISFVFGGGVTVDLAAAGVLYVGSVKQVCLAFAPNGDDSDTTIFGNVQQKTLQVVYDAAGGNQPGCASSSNACIYGIQYGDSSFSVGYFSRERLTVTATEVVDNFLFGCGQNNQGLFGGSAGLLGLGRNPISFVEQTATKYKKLFAYCLPSTASNVGYLTFGRVADNYIKYTPLSTNSGVSSFYALDLLGIYVGGAKLSISSSTFSTGGTIIDSGTVITRLPPTAYSALRTEFQKGMSRYPKASALSILDTCYDLSGYKVFAIPKISFVFGGGVTVDLAAAGVLYVGSVKQVCLAFAPNGDDSDTTIFGNVQQKTLQVVYDAAGGKVGFGVGGCK
ncbi:hypothetical protein TanjilG_19499 [Lupinus angustifolius]|uniref:Peptidase A1 domain-containing protein n=1 Tax=Lupinus angustifolius TaxID=3871 RepID=A0A1J7INY4_LUPAN|nr:hypothetical protein TanjilG_19499 [Lupinus angustifolius]